MGGAKDQADGKKPFHFKTKIPAETCKKLVSNYKKGLQTQLDF